MPCKQCGAILNPYATVDYNTKVWICPFCYTRCHFPPHYQGISQQNLPAELYPQYTTIEYTLNRTVPWHPPVYLFVVDTCVAEDELHACQTAITRALQDIPEDCHVGLITFGTHVHVHELGFSECSKCYVFRGSKEYTTQQVVDQLGLRPVAARPGAPGAAPQQPPAKQFILPLADPNCDTAINNVLTDLQRDAYPVPPSMRPARCTGTALQVGWAAAVGRQGAAAGTGGEAGAGGVWGTGGRGYQAGVSSSRAAAVAAAAAGVVLAVARAQCGSCSRCSQCTAAPLLHWVRVKRQHAEPVGMAWGLCSCSHHARQD